MVTSKQGLAYLRDLPVLIIFGDPDPTFEAGFMALFKQFFPLSRSIIIKGAGHFTPEEAPDEITSVIRSLAKSSRTGVREKNC